MIHGIPVIGTVISFILSFFCAIPFYFIWNNLAPTYFPFMPEVWQSIPFWDAVGLFMLVPIISWVIRSLTPRIATVNNTNSWNQRSHE